MNFIAAGRHSSPRHRKPSNDGDAEKSRVCLLVRQDKCITGLCASSVRADASGLAGLNNRARGVRLPGMVAQEQARAGGDEKMKTYMQVTRI